MIDRELLDILVCPETKEPVRLADEAELARINRAIENGSVRNRAGEAVRTPLEAALVRDDWGRAYPVREGIPIMLVDQAIDLDAVP